MPPTSARLRALLTPLAEAHRAHHEKFYHTPQPRTHTFATNVTIRPHLSERDPAAYHHCTRGARSAVAAHSTLAHEARIMQMRAMAVEFARLLGTIPLFSHPQFSTKLSWAYVGSDGIQRLSLDLNGVPINRNPLAPATLASRLASRLALLGRVPASDPWHTYSVGAFTLTAPGPAQALFLREVLITGHPPTREATQRAIISQFIPSGELCAQMDGMLACL